MKGLFTGRYRRLKILASIAILSFSALALMAAISMLDVIEPDLPDSGAVEEAVGQLIILPGRGLFDQSIGRFAIMRGGSLIAEAEDGAGSETDDDETGEEGDGKQDDDETGKEGDSKQDDDETGKERDSKQDDDRENLEVEEMGEGEAKAEELREIESQESGLEEGVAEDPKEADSQELGPENGEDAQEEESEHQASFLGTQTEEGEEDLAVDDPKAQYFHLPVFEVIGTKGITYLRTDSREIYDNGWHSYDGLPFIQYQGEDIELNITADIIDEKVLSIKPIEPLSGFLPVILYANQLKTAEGQLAYYPDKQAFYSNFLLEDTYDFSATLYDYDNLLLKYALLDKPQELEDFYTRNLLGKATQLPDEMIADLAYQITGWLPTGNYCHYDGALQIKNYLKENYSYQHSFLLTDCSYDNIRKFLFSQQQGSVLDFNTSFALLARELSIPTRMAYGYRIDPEREYQVVYTDQAYEYSEVYLEGVGWVIFDAVPVYQFYHPPQATYSWIDEVNDTIIKGEEISVEGQVVDSIIEGIDGLKILIYIRKQPKDDSLSYNQAELSKGKYSTEFVVDKNVAVGPNYVVAKVLENDIYKTSLSYRPITVFSETKIHLTMPDRVYLGNDIPISCTLTEKITPVPLASENIKLTLNSASGETTETLEGTTDVEGIVEFTLPTDFIEPEKTLFSLQLLEKRPVTALVTFDGAEFYFASEATGETFVWIIYWYRALLLLFTIMLVLFGVIVVYKYLSARKPKPAIISEPSGAIAETMLETGYPLLIEFPDINEPLPPIWGFNEALNIRLTSDDDDLNNNLLQMRFGDGYKESFTFKDNQLFSYNYAEKGTFNLIASKQEETKISGSANIKIVDYREEMIETAQNIFKTLQLIDHNFGNELTPRELLIKGLKDATTITMKNRSDMIFLLEYAIYSLKTISRKDYVKFYLLSINVNKYLEGLL